MNTSKLNDRLQIAASIGVLLGLLIVAYEIRQNTSFAEAEYTEATYGHWMQISHMELETDIGEIAIRAVEDPESLTDLDKFKLNAWLVFAISIYDHQDRSRNLGIAPSYARMGQADAHYYFSSQYARDWFEVNRDWMRPTVVETIAHAIESSPVASDWNILDRP